MTSSSMNETEAGAVGLTSIKTMPLILPAQLGLWLAVLRLDGRDYCFGLFGSREAAERMLAVALERAS